MVHTGQTHHGETHIPPVCSLRGQSNFFLNNFQLDILFLIKITKIYDAYKTRFSIFSIILCYVT